MGERLESIEQLFQHARRGGMCPECPALASILGEAADALAVVVVEVDGPPLERYINDSNILHSEFVRATILGRLEGLVAKSMSDGCIGPVPNTDPEGISELASGALKEMRNKRSELSVELGYGEVEPEAYRCSLVDLVI